MEEEMEWYSWCFSKNLVQPSRASSLAQASANLPNSPGENMGGNAAFCFLEGGVGHEGVDCNVTEVTIVLE